jgi:dGTPase
MSMTFNDFREKALLGEKESLHSKASLTANHSRYQGSEDDHRLPYKRDVDRIIHSKAYSRYVDKTQVAYLVCNDHITHRSLHVQLVSNFARGIAEILRLNLDLVEAIALGHDVGHPPFGHEGEGYLSEISLEFGEGPFAHPAQSCRLFRDIEPLNLGLLVYDGFLCHDGGMRDRVVTPVFGKTWESHFEEYSKKFADPGLNLAPGSLEGALVKLSDTMSYIGRDIEDAISLGILTRKDVPKTILGTTNREILANLARDVIENSYEQDYIALSKESFDALWTLRRFNFEKIYQHPKLKVESDKVRTGYRQLFHVLLDDFRQKGSESHLYRHFLNSKSEGYVNSTSEVRKIIDYISGMTDNYFVRCLEKLFIPARIEL